MVNEELEIALSSYNSKSYSLVNATEDLLEAVRMNTVRRQLWKWINITECNVPHHDA